MATLEEKLEELRNRAEWFELRPHWGPGASQVGWSISMRSFNRIFELTGLYIGDTVDECVDKALKSLGSAPVRAVQPRNTGASTKSAPKPVAAATAPPRRLLKKK